MRVYYLRNIESNIVYPEVRSAFIGTQYSKNPKLLHRHNADVRSGMDMEIPCVVNEVQAPT